MKNLSLAAAAAAFTTLMLSAPAMAQDFTGVRAEVRAGFDGLSIDDDYEDIADSLSGTGFGVSAGYDHAIAPGYTLGLEAGILIPSGTKESVALGADTLALETKRDLEVLVRVGRVVNDKTLIFAKAGYANSRIEAAYTSLAHPGEVERSHEDYDGFRLGVGAERVLSGGFSATAEYRFTRYNDELSRNQVLVGLAYRF